MTPTIPPVHFPAHRPRRTRQSPWSRALMAEHELSVNDLIWPIFVIDGDNKREPVPSMPGVERVSIDLAVEKAAEARDLGIPAIEVFPNTAAEARSSDGREATNPDNLVCRTLRAIKAAVPDIGIMCDVALDPYTDHGHDGLLQDGKIANDATVEVLVQQALVQRAAGADILGPSDMMDGRIGAIRNALEKAGDSDALILSYAAKYASVYYGPFRDAVGSGTRLKGDKRSYQMDAANTQEALREVALDLQEGADMVMVKPGLLYLDIITRVKDAFAVPTVAYHVSGEYAMLMAAVQNGWLPAERALLETMMAFKRAGCDGVLTYAAPQVARLLRAGSA
ncbi:MAG: porphobilinogen synthase [Pseudomonadota bacterium]